MKTVLVDDRGSALGSFESLREGIRALRKLYFTDTAAITEVALMVLDAKGHPIEIIDYEDVSFYPL